MALREFQTGTSEYADALQLRAAVLRAPLGLRLTDADLADEAACCHIGGFDGGRLIAVLLLRPLDARTVKMRQVAVHPDFQKSGTGSRLMAFAEGVAKAHGFTTMIAHARATALGFYQKVGYEVVGEEFIETTIPHRLVTKTL